MTLDARNVGVPVTLASPATAPTTGAHFTVTKRAVYAFWGLAPLTTPKLEKILAGQLIGARAITDVKIKVRSKWSDVLITVLTGGIFVPRAVTVEGTVVADSAAVVVPAK